MTARKIDAIFKRLKAEKIKFVDLRFTDTRGKEQHISISTSTVDKDLFQHGKMFDGSSIVGWKSINESDMILLPDLDTMFVDPFFDELTMVFRCNILDPETGKPYNRDPRSLAQRAEKYLKDSKLADTCYFGPEPEFFIFDDVRWDVKMDKVYYHIDSREAAWNSATVYEGGNYGHRPRIKGGYFPVPPVDSSQDLRSAMVLTMEDLGLQVEAHHHEVATSNQNEINTKFSSLLTKADQIMVYKYVVHNVAHLYGKTATFMPKPLVDDNGSGMHCHISLFKAGKNLFSGNKYGGLSTQALHFIGGIIHHARALNAFTNPATNSYKRLVPGFEAPVILAYSKRNRSASIRIPYVENPKAARIEVRFPDALANPYLAFSAMLLAGLDGIKHKMDPGSALDIDLYHSPEHELKDIPRVASSLDEALIALEEDHQFLLAGDVFSTDMIQAYIALKREEVTRLRMVTHPIEFDMYYSG